MSSVLITEDGQVTEVHPADGKKFTLAELQQYVKGRIELIAVKYVGKRRNAFVNEEGLLKGLKQNGVYPDFRGNILIIDNRHMNFL